jgi:hypothetical protein
MPNVNVEYISIEHPAVNQNGWQLRPSASQSDRLAKALHSGHPDAGGIYHATVRLSLVPGLDISNLR